MNHGKHGQYFFAQPRNLVTMSDPVRSETLYKEEKKFLSGESRVFGVKDGVGRIENPANEVTNQLGKKFITDSNPALSYLENVTSLLMLQGPIGPLFHRIEKWKRQQGHHVKRVIFNAGDAAYCGDDDALHFRQSPEEWPRYLHECLHRYAIDGVILFGQNRIFHKEAIRICKLLNVRVFVMEEGYVRPGFVTLEMDGVNALSETLKKYDLKKNAFIKEPPPARVRFRRLKLAMHAINYYVLMKIGAYKYPNYIHHRHDSLFLYAGYWGIAIISYPFSRWNDKQILSKFDFESPYFFIPLQLDSDSQILFHSRFLSIKEFLIEVLRSFSIHAAPNARLIIKQHPLARGHLGQRKKIMRIAEKLRIDHRVIFIHHCKIHQLLDNVSGVITINSTVGVQAISRGVPLKVMGEAIYDHPGVADPQPLDTFWANPFRPHPEHAKAFHRRLKLLTQLPAELYESRKTPLGWSQLQHQAPGGNQ